MAKSYLLDDDTVHDCIKDYILLMLGAPVVKIELDETQISMCINRTCQLMSSVAKVSDWSEKVQLMFAQEGALAQAKMILGRIRAKYGLDSKGVNSKSKSGTNVVCALDGNQLLAEGEKQYQDWQRKVFGKIGDKK